VRVLVVTNMYPTTRTPAVGTFVYDQVASLRRAGVHVDVLHVNGRDDTWNYLRGFLRFWRVLAHHRYDVIHAHYVFCGVIARAQWTVPVVLTHHGPEVLGFPRWQTWLAKLVTPLFDEVIYVSEQMRRALNDADGWVIPCGIDLGRFIRSPREEARATLGLPPEKPLVLWAGEHWRPEKRFSLVEQAIDVLKVSVPEAELVLLSQRPHELVPAYMSACDSLVLTSALEGSPMVVKEAMACDLPIVSVPVGDVPEVIDGTAGCTIVEQEPDRIALGLAGVLRHRERTDGRSRVGRYAINRIADSIVEVYRHAIDRRRRRDRAR
jgi:teichuronic acid biosynthesis glycosyltransferase TuaC